MDELELQRRLALARRLAGDAGRLLLSFKLDLDGIVTKASQDFVTEADAAAERLIREGIARDFPEDSVLGEEQGGALGERLWVVDPIDGTINFIRGLPSYAVSIAFVERGSLELGVVCVPMLNEVFEARRGGGAFCNGSGIRVSGCRSLAEARVAAGYAQRGSKALHLRFLARLLRAGTDIVKVNSAAVCLAMTAAGRIDGYFEPELMSWDVLAGQLLVREAGGWTNDFGAHGLLRRDYCIACAPPLAGELRAAAAV